MSTYAQLKIRVFARLGFDETVGEQDEVQVGTYLNDAVLDFLIETHCQVSLATNVALTAGAGDYELDTDTLAIHKIIDSDNRPLERLDESEIHELRRASSSGSGLMVYAVAGANMLMVWPTPQAAATLTVYFVPKPTAMSADSNDPATKTYGGIPSEYHKALEAYACWQAADYDDDASSQMGQRYQAEYGGWIMRFRKAQKMRGGRRQARAMLGNTRRRHSDPSRT